MKHSTGRPWRLIAATTVLAALILAGEAGAVKLAADAGGGNNPRILPPNSMPNGKSYGDWGAAFWAWDYSLPFANNPIFDPTGAAQEQNQSGPVWFLAGNAGGSSVRRVTVPTGKMIFFPLVNAINDYPCPDPTFQPAPGQTLEQFLTAGAKAIFDPVASGTALTLTVDGASMGNLLAYRATSHMFTFTADPSMSAFDGCVTGAPQQGVADGYWIMLAPFPPGAHSVHFTAAIPAYGLSLDVAYEIDVSNSAGVVTAPNSSDVTHTGVALSGNEAGTPTTWGKVKSVYR